MARFLYFIAALLLFLFGLGYLGGRSQNLPLIAIGIVFFLLMFFSPQNKEAKPAQQLLHLPEPQIRELRKLIKENKKPKAIKRYRNLTNASLKQSKDYIDRLEQDSLKNQHARSISLPLPRDLEQDVIAIKAQSLIEAVREVRGLTGVSIREAKDYVDKL